ncbi:DNA-binding protein [Stygiolobus azoricus]|uniref:DNA-binding protein n=2 Tax=Stygiolobus azoricus TaxID=41675 RepID=A0A650CRY4_9CREN|nr:DNA-binding protein [Stygiolobus azoricus]
MEVYEYVYTAGKNGEEFFKALKDKKILGGRCEKCGRVFVPPKMFCEYCFGLLKLEEIKGKPIIDSFTVIYYDNDGKKLETPITVGFISFEGVEGGILAYVEGVPEIGKEVEILEYNIPLRVKVK